MIRPALWILLLAPVVAAQAGDRKDRPGTEQAPPPEHWQIPAAPALSPADELASFRIAVGYRIELVASEPLVQDPVAIAFDAASRMWVVEMRAYMPNADGEGEQEPEGRIAILTDSDGDGAMDQRVDYLTGLAMPRAVLPLGGGEALVLAPPNFWHCKDLDGDMVCDDKQIVGAEFANGFSDPEHAANAPTFGIDGWIHFARYDRRARYDGERWSWEPVADGGQWGLTRDDFGRWFFNTNSDHLRGHPAAPHYAARHAGLRGPAFVNQRYGKSQAVFPDRITPGVNRGYRKGTLREDGRLAKFTAVCGPGVHRAPDAAPDLAGFVFIPEPACHVVRRERVQQVATSFAGVNADGEGEFWTSQDERFRPVNALTGPDGGLYVVDMYRGLIQHRNYLTTYLRQQVDERGLALPIHMGRIWRVVPGRVAAARRVEWPDLEAAGPAGRAAALASSNGAVRDLAQREIVRRGDRGALAALVDVATSGALAPRVQALWTLHELDRLDRATLFQAFNDTADGSHPELLEHALRLAEPRLAAGRDGLLLGRVTGLVATSEQFEPRVRMQLAFTLGAVSHGDAEDRAEAEVGLRALLQRFGHDAVMRDAVVAGLGGVEVEFLRGIAADPDWAEGPSHRGDVARRIAAAGFAAGDPGTRRALLALAADPQARWVADVTLDGIVSVLPRKGSRPIELRGDETVLERIFARTGTRAAKAIARMREMIAFGELAALEPLSPEDAERFEHGRGLYATNCAQCHQPTGDGLGGVAPPLHGSEWVLGSEQRLARIVLQGLTGPIEVAGQPYDFPTMPDHGRMTDEELASILTYIRRAWDHAAPPVQPATVRAVRDAEAGRGQPWTAPELQALGER